MCIIELMKIFHIKTTENNYNRVPLVDYEDEDEEEIFVNKKHYHTNARYFTEQQNERYSTEQKENMNYKMVDHKNEKMKKFHFPKFNQDLAEEIIAPSTKSITSPTKSLNKFDKNGRNYVDEEIIQNNSTRHLQKTTRNVYKTRRINNSTQELNRNESSHTNEEVTVLQETTSVPSPSKENQPTLLELSQMYQKNVEI